MAHAVARGCAPLVCVPVFVADIVECCGIWVYPPGFGRTSHCLADLGVCKLFPFACDAGLLPIYWQKAWPMGEPFWFACLRYGAAIMFVLVVVLAMEIAAI